MSDVINASLVDMIVHNIRGHTLLKDAKTGKYLDANSTHLEVYGLNKPSDIIGYTIWDINNFMSPMWKDNANQVTEFEQMVIHTGKPFINPKRVWLNANGFVWVHHMSKLPVIGNNNSITAILSIGDDLTYSVKLDELYQYYCHFYKDKKLRITMFLTHIKVQNLFYEMPTNSEMMVLIAKARLHNNKLVATHLNLQLSTVESYINQLGRKAIDLTTVFNILRMW